MMCSGRVTWDLMVERAKREDGAKFAIGRVERLYPNPVDEIRAEIAKYPNLKAIRWVQDEPRNMGPWPHYQLNVWPELDLTVEPITRPRPRRRRSARSSATPRSRRRSSTRRSSRRAAGGTRLLSRATGVYFTDRGIEELERAPG